MDAPDTVTAAERSLERSGYDHQVVVRDGALVFTLAGAGRDAVGVCPVGQALVEVVYRFEGDSDPGDEMVVFGVRDPGTGRRGTLVSAFGPAADPEVADHVALLASRWAGS